MINNKEGPNLPRHNSNRESLDSLEREVQNFYKGILYREATSLLVKYLPDALPHQPTDIGFSVFPGSIGYFKGKHYIDTSPLAFWPMIFGRVEREEREKSKEISRESEREQWEHRENFIAEQMKELGLPFEPEVYVPKPNRPETEIEPDEQDKWHELSSSLESRKTYTPVIWRDIGILIHELIHQKQAELNPAINPDFALFPELVDLDPDSMNRGDLGFLLRTSIPGKKDGSFQKAVNSISKPVSEGIAVMGSLYVMQKLADDLRKEGDEETAVRVTEAKTEEFRKYFSANRNPESVRREPTTPQYVEGIKIVSKLYKQFGIENLPRILSAIDLKACQNIAVGSPEYQQVTEDPSLLPGLPKAA